MELILSDQHLEKIEGVLDRQANQKSLTLGEVIVILEDLLKTVSPEAWQIYRKIDSLQTQEYAQTIDSVYRLGYETGRNEAFNDLGLWKITKNLS